MIVGSCIHKIYKDSIAVKLAKIGFEFEASHNLVNYNGDCSNLHGHSYKLNVEVEGVPNQHTGLVIDFKSLKQVVQDTIIDHVDHKYLNDAMPEAFSMQGNTTCENMIIAFWWVLDHEITERFKGVRLSKIELYETSNSKAILTREMIYNAR